MQNAPLHYLNFSDLSAAQYDALLTNAVRIKKEVKDDIRRSYLRHRLLLMLFEKHSTRTRASFLAAMTQGDGVANEINMADLQIERGESISDTARVLSSFADWLMLRVARHETLTAFAEHAVCPVINGLSDVSHPCQVLADVMTYREHRGELTGRTIAWLGDCSNVLYSWAEAAAVFGCRLRIACPQPYRRPLPVTATDAVSFTDTPEDAVADADLVMTDVWVSMGDDNADQRRAAFADYQVSAERMALAATDALFMHCLPAHRGEEVAAAVIDGKHSVVWQQAENRLHAQKALLLYLLDEATATPVSS